MNNPHYLVLASLNHFFSFLFFGVGGYRERERERKRDRQRDVEKKGVQLQVKKGNTMPFYGVSQ